AHRVAPEDVEARHGLGEWQHAEQRARRETGGDVAFRVRAADEWAEAALRHDDAGRREQAPLEQLAARDLALRQRLENLPAVPARVLRLAQSRSGCFLRKKYRHCLLVVVGRTLRNQPALLLDILRGTIGRRCLLPSSAACD